MIRYHTIYIPVRVPLGPFCFSGTSTCGHLEYEGALPVCALGFSELEYDKKDNIKRSPQCLKLDPEYKER